MARTARRAYTSLRAWRTATNTKQETLARKAGISQQHLANVEVGARSCSLAVAIRLSQITNVPVELIGAVRATSVAS